LHFLRVSELPSGSLAATIRRPIAPAMNRSVVSIHPYFTIHPGQLEAAKALLPAFVERTADEPACLHYEFTRNGDVVFCREAYLSGEGALAHLENVDALLKQLLTISDLTRLEIHGPAAELAKLKGPLATLQPAWFELECGLER
jgi:quinol monooxygenase YgiN